MKKLKTGKILAIAGIIVAVVVLIGILYIIYFLPNIPLNKDIKVGSTSVRIEHGKYLANHVTVCIDCHSTRDWTRFSGPPMPGTEGKGGEKFDQSKGFPGEFYAANITPYHLEKWSDAEIYRAITSGVSSNGHALFPVMPYPYYGQMDTEDIFSLIAYIRTLAPITNDPAKSKADFPMNLILHFIPKHANPQSLPLKTDTASYGKYLVMAASCIECHTQVKNGQIIPGKSFSGGRDFPISSGIVSSANITPDPQTGIGKWTRQTFIARFKAYDPAINPVQPAGKGDFNSLMPWTMYAGMDTTDLVAVFSYLRTVKPMVNQVVKFKAFTN